MAGGKNPPAGAAAKQGGAAQSLLGGLPAVTFTQALCVLAAVRAASAAISHITGEDLELLSVPRPAMSCPVMPCRALLCCCCPALPCPALPCPAGFALVARRMCTWGWCSAGQRWTGARPRTAAARAQQPRHASARLHPMVHGCAAF